MILSNAYLAVSGNDEYNGGDDGHNSDDVDNDGDCTKRSWYEAPALAKEGHRQEMVGGPAQDKKSVRHQKNSK